MSEVEAALRAEIARLNRIIEALMNRAERSTDPHGTDFTLFQTTVMLEEQIEVRTAELETALRDNERVTRALRESEAKYRGVVDQSLVGISIIEEGRFTYSNPHFDEIFGYSAEEIRRLGPTDIAVEEERPLVVEQIRRRMAGEVERVHYQLRARRKDGTPIDIEIYGNRVDLGSRHLLISVVQDVTERARAADEVRALQGRLREQSIRDALTNLYNRRYLEETLGRELILAARNGTAVGLIMCDIDHFKRVNDRHGHQAGDEVLRTFAGWLTQHARASDICCRFGGEEFLLVLPGMTTVEAVERAEQLRCHVAANPISWHGAAISITASFGVAVYPRDGRTGEPLITAADQALYAAKASGRNRVVCVPQEGSSQVGSASGS